MPKLLFTQDDAIKANREWGMNCGPAALAAACCITLGKVRKAVNDVGFADKGYMNVTMMQAASGPEVDIVYADNEPQLDAAAVKAWERRS